MNSHKEKWGRKVYIVGAGPGDPELITLKGRRIIDSADVVLYAGSLVNREVLGRGAAAEVFDTAGMSLEEIIGVIKEAVDAGKNVARVHTGDPTIYSAVAEQARELKSLGIEYEIVPGVSSFSASAAALGREFTPPGVSQTVILARAKGRTDVPDSESLKELSRHRASMALFLSAGLVEEVQASLLEAYPPDTPVAVVYKASWPDERAVMSTVSDLAKDTREAGITNFAQILVGDFLLGESLQNSKLYDPTFSHGFRNDSETEL